MRHARTKDEGFALMLVLIILAIVFLLLMVQSTQTFTTTRILQLRLIHQGQALNAAHAGLVEGLDYFRRQTPPVTTFDPQRDMTASPPVDETDIETTPPSIQRDFLISAVGNVWGHYELHQGDSDDATQVADLTQNRRGSTAGAGSIWQLESTGMVYVRNDASKPPSESPNLIISTKTVRTEIQRVALNLPANAGLITSTGGASCRVGVTGSERVRVVGGASGAGVVTKSGSPSVAASATLSGTPASSTSPGMDFSVNGVFNISTLADLAAIADHNVTDVAHLPATLPMRLVVINVPSGTATFGAGNPLTGSGILVVNGNLNIAGGPSSYNGIIYVTGNFTMTGPATINGSVLVAGASSTVTISGSSEFAEIYYDRFMRTQVASQLGQFRFARPAFIPCPPNDPLCDSRFAEN